MNQKALKTLEFDKIIHRLTEHAASVGAKKKCTELVPVTSLWEIERAQTQTADALRRIWQKGSISFGGIRDIRGSIKRLEIGGILGMGELRQIMSLLETAGQVQKYGAHEREDEKADSLDESFEFLDPIPSLCSEIRRCILADDEMADDASSALFSIRRSMRQMNDKVHNTLNAMVNGAVRTYLQDAVITMRDGRYCLPVKAEHRSQVPGMIHDQSATGSTLFIEPMAVVKLNNDFKELLLKEQQEIEKILSELSEKTAAYADQISGDYDVLVELDFIFAKAILAKEMNAVRPVFNDQRRINIKEGRHPLLDPKKVVPVTVRLGDDFRLLIITGPNTGGKTVSLKTVGLFTLMGQAGLHIPAFEGSELGVFGDVFADIGDEQSIEQSLSTFSSHMKNIVEITEHCDDRSLVLFDELGAGTDPAEGAALAVAVIEFCRKLGAKVAGTTHYGEMKLYAMRTEGVMNASCEFDVETLRPTYRLLIGIPGKSNAFAISKRLGLSEVIIDDARSLVSENDVNFEDVLSQLEAQRQAMEQARIQAEQLKLEVEKTKQQSEAYNLEIKKERDKAVAKARKEAQAIIDDARRSVNIAMDEIKQMKKQLKDAGAVEDFNQRQTELRRGLNTAEDKLSQKAPQETEKKVSARPPRQGDTVELLKLGTRATVLSVNKDGSLQIQAGIMKLTVKPQEVYVLPQQDTQNTVKKFVEKANRQLRNLATSSEVDLRGMTADEAISVLDRFLDDAMLAKLPSVRIIHGKGTGVLRKAVQQHLKRSPRIKSVRLGVYGEGEDGVTIAELDV